MSAKNWLVCYLDGRYVSDEEKHWTEISVNRLYGREVLVTLKEPAASLTVYMSNRRYTLRAPDQDTRFYRHYRARTALGFSQSDLLYHEIGYIAKNMRVRMEIDPKGNCQTRVEVLDPIEPIDPIDPLDPIEPLHSSYGER